MGGNIDNQQEKQQEDKQSKENRIERLSRYRWKKGQSGNPNGRPVGKSLKEWTRDRLQKMDDEERMEFLNSLSPDIAWKMAEGNPTSELTGKDGEKLFNDDNKRSGKHSISSFLGIGKTD